MDQLDLFPNVRPTDPDTSHGAAKPNRVTLRQQVEVVLRHHPDGLTDYELTEQLGLDRHRKPSVGKRRQELFAIDTGVRRRSPDGHLCVVWALQNWPAGTERGGVLPATRARHLSGVTSAGQHTLRRPAQPAAEPISDPPGSGTIHQLRTEKGNA